MSHPTHYLPTDRRPIADTFRLMAKRSTSWCVRKGVHPNTVSYASVVAAALAATSFAASSVYPSALAVGSFCCLVRLYLNMLDGMVAIESGVASAIGEIVNELPDRFSDVLIFVGVGYSGLCYPTLGYWAAICSLLVAYVGTLGSAAGARRDFSGPMSKPWRMVALCVGAIVTLFVQRPLSSIPLTTLDWSLVLVVVGCCITIVRRLKNIVIDLRSCSAKETE